MPSDSSTEKLKIGDLARLSGLSERTLRYYEKLGIILPSRSEGGTRYYSGQDLEIGLLAKRMRDLDIPVQIIQTIAIERCQHATGDDSSAALANVLDALCLELDERQKRTALLRDEISRTIKQLKRCKGCKNIPSPSTCPDCPMERLRKPTSLSRMIWRET